MPTPFDLKVLFKQVVSDPKGLNLPTLPSTAIVSGNAVGAKGNWTGVYGHSERSIALYAESPVFAGFFQGDVQINGDLTLETGGARIAGDLAVTGNLNVQGRSFNQLAQRVDELEQQGENLAQLGPRVSALEQRLDALESQRLSTLEQKVAGIATQTNSAVGNLTGRTTQAEVAISDLRAKVQQIIAQLG